MRVYSTYIVLKISYLSYIAKKEIARMPNLNKKFFEVHTKIIL